MSGSPFLKVALAITIITIVLFPLYAIFIEYPSFEKHIAENTAQEAVRIAKVLSSVLVEDQAELRADRLPKEFLKHVQELRDDARILKLKIFNLSGTVVYSTDPGEIGRINEEDYFKLVATTGGVKAVEVPKNVQTLERQVLPADVVETYVPIMRDRTALGVFEIYYDISGDKERLRALVGRSTAALVGVAAILVLVLVVVLHRAARMARERAQAEDALKVSEERYRTLFEHAGDSIFILDGAGADAGRIIAANHAAAAMHGYSVDELRQMKITDLDTPEAAREAPGMVRRILDGEWIKAELSHRRKDGSVFPVEVSAGPLQLGGHTYILALDRDITQRRQIEAARENLIKDLREAFEKIKVLKGLLPICSSCKKIRDDKGYWNRIEEYIGTHSEAEFTHGICPDCRSRLYPRIPEKKLP